MVELCLFFINRTVTVKTKCLNVYLVAIMKNRCHLFPWRIDCLMVSNSLAIPVTQVKLPAGGLWWYNSRSTKQCRCRGEIWLNLIDGIERFGIWTRAWKISWISTSRVEREDVLVQESTNCGLSIKSDPLPIVNKTLL